MELRHLRYFIAVADELNFGRAAKQLHISQPPLSQQIQQLEAEIGVNLIDRSKRQIQLTHAGKVLRQQAELILSQVEQAKKLTVHAGKSEGGELRIAWLMPTHAAITDFIKAFMNRYPGVHLTIKRLLPQEQIDALRD